MLGLQERGKLESCRLLLSQQLSELGDGLAAALNAVLHGAEPQEQLLARSAIDLEARDQLIAQPDQHGIKIPSKGHHLRASFPCDGLPSLTLLTHELQQFD